MRILMSIPKEGKSPPFRFAFDKLMNQEESEAELNILQHTHYTPEEKRYYTIICHNWEESLAPDFQVAADRERLNARA